MTDHLVDFLVLYYEFSKGSNVVLEECFQIGMEYELDHEFAIGAIDAEGNELLNGYPSDDFPYLILYKKEDKKEGVRYSGELK